MTPNEDSTGALSIVGNPTYSELLIDDDSEAKNQQLKRWRTTISTLCLLTTLNRQHPTLPTDASGHSVAAAEEPLRQRGIGHIRDIVSVLVLDTEVIAVQFSHDLLNNGSAVSSTAVRSFRLTAIVDSSPSTMVDNTDDLDNEMAKLNFSPEPSFVSAASRSRFKSYPEFVKRFLGRHSGAQRKQTKLAKDDKLQSPPKPTIPSSILIPSSSSPILSSSVNADEPGKLQKLSIKCTSNSIAIKPDPHQNPTIHSSAPPKPVRRMQQGKSKLSEFWPCHPEERTQWKRLITLLKLPSTSTKKEESFDETRFSDHVATFQQFLVEHKKIQDDKTRWDIRKEFGRYIIIACWRKMHRRIKHWSNLGYIHTIAHDIPSRADMGGKYRAWRNSSNGPGSSIARRRDGALRILFGQIKAEVPFTIPDMLSHVKNAMDVWPAAPLATAFEAFTEDLSFHFHNILSAALIMLLHSLLALDVSLQQASAQGPISTLVETDNSNHHVEHIIQVVEHIKFYTDIVWRISQSAMFTFHLEMLALNKMLNKPQFSLKPMYERDMGVKDREHNVFDDSNDGNDDSGSDVNVAKKSIRLLVEHTSAFDGLAMFMIPGPKSEFVPTIDIETWVVTTSLQSQSALPWRELVNSCIPEIITPTGSSIEQTVTEPDQAAIMREIEDRILQVSAPTLSTQAKSIITRFKESRPIEKEKEEGKAKGKATEKVVMIRNEPYFARSQLHCEAILATLEDALAAQPESSEVKTGPAATQPEGRQIAVSKLCCPVCWDLLELLDGFNRFGVEGRHSTLSILDLPPWISLEHIKTMNYNYGRHITRELGIMLANRSNKLLRIARNPSHQSIKSIDSQLREVTANNEVPDNDAEDVYVAKGSAYF